MLSAVYTLDGFDELQPYVTCLATYVITSEDGRIASVSPDPSKEGT
jgi:hypothetical protein